MTWHNLLDVIIETKALSRILLFGPPDTGKSTAAVNAAKKLDRPCFRCQCAPQQGIEDLLGNWTLVDGKTVFVPGPIARAMTAGGVLLLDEFDRRNKGHDSIYHALLDDPAISSLNLPNGETIKPAPGFMAIYANNGQRIPAIVQRHSGNMVDLNAVRWLLNQPAPRILMSDLEFCRRSQPLHPRSSLPRSLIRHHCR